MAPMSPVPAARSVSSRMRNFSPAVNVRRLGRFDNSGLAAAGAGTTVGLRPSSVPAPAAACASATLLGMTTRQFSYALKSKLLGACVSSSLARRAIDRRLLGGFRGEGGLSIVRFALCRAFLARLGLQSGPNAGIPVSCGRDQGKHALQVPGHGHKVPLTLDLIEPAQQELAESQHGR